MKSCMFEGAFKKKGRLLLALAALFFVLAEAGPARAKSVAWQGGTNSNWNTGSNWVWDGGVPGAGDSATIGVDTITTGDSPRIGPGASGVTGYLVVGGSADGALTIEGSLTSGTALLGNDQASKAAVGFVTVKGSSASWTNTGDLYVGNYSSSLLDMQNGAHVSANLVNIGAESGSSGTVNLNGSGTALNLAASLFVGYGGTGALSIGDDTTVTSVGAVLGNNAGGSGSAFVDGGSWNTGSGTILIGGNGQGDLTVQNGGTLTSTGGTVGWGGTAATTSTATVNGTGSKWTSSDSLYVGNNATGILNIQNGGAVSTTQSLFVGSNSGSDGTVNLTGSGSSLNVAQGLYVGYQGTGALNVGAGTTVNTGTLNVGHETNGNGTVTVSGAGAALTATNGAFLGYGANSSASLTVSAGGSFETVTEGLYLQSGSTMTVSGTGTTVNIGSEHSGTPATWPDSDGWLYLHEATVNVSNGAHVETDGLYVSGAPNGGTATMTVTGPGTVLDGKLCIYVGGDGNDSGTTGNGSLTISNGATASATILSVGNDTGLTGTLLVTGAGSSLTTVPNVNYVGNVYAGYTSNGAITVSDGASLTAAGALRVGWADGSTGTVNVESGSTLTSHGAVIGNEFGATGAVTVTGAGTTWTDVDYGVTVGLSGTGRLEVSDGAAVTAKYLYVGQENGSSGTLLLTGAGTKLTTTIGAYAGSQSNTQSGASVTITDGATLETVGGGLYVQSNSTLNVSGSGSKVLVGTLHSGTPPTWNDADGWMYLHSATVNVSDGARVEADGLYVSGAPSGSAAMTVTGPNTVLDGKLLIYVGGDGNDSGTTGAGMLTIADGATASASVIATGVDVGTPGTILVTGAGSSLSSVNNAGTFNGKVYAGYQDAGTITVQNGASLSAAGDLRVGWADGSRGTVNVESGSTVTSANGVIGYESAATGTVTVTGAGSSWTNNDEIVVGWSGTGTMTVEAGATVANVHEGTVGYQAGSHGTVTVTGPGSTWTNGSELVVGWSGTGEMTVANGGKVTNTNGFLGARDGGSGTATVTGAGSIWESSSQLILGYGASTGLLTIENGGKVINSDGRIGLSANSTGTVTVTGANSTLTDNGAILRVGYDGTGTLTIADGGLVTVGTATGGVYDGAVNIATNAGSRGTLNIGAAEGSSAAAAGTLRAASVVFGNGTGEIVFNHTSSGLQFDSAISGNGAVKVLAGTTVFTGANTYSGATTITEGTLKAGAANTFSGNSAVAVSASGTLDLNNSNQTIGGLSGAGTVSLGSGVLTVNSAADSAFSGTITGTGGLTKDGAGILTLSGTNDYSGATTVNGGTLRAGAVNVFSQNSIVTVNNGGTLDLNNFDQTIVDLSGNGRVNLGSATLTVTNNTAVNDFTLTGSGGVTKTGTGTLTLSGSGSNYTGETAVTAGTLQAGATNAFSPNSTVDVSTGGTVDLNNYSQAVGGLTGSGAVTLGSATLTVGNTTDNSFSGTISGTGGLTKTGSGVLTLTGNNSYTGPTTIQQGTLSLTGSTASSSMAVSSGAILDFSPTQNLAYTGAISGDGAVTKTGTSTLTLTGTNAYTGGTTISGGTLAISSDANLGASTGALALAGGTLQTTAAVSTSRPITVTGSGTIDNTGNAVTMSGNLLGSGNLSLAGSGTDTLGATFNGSGYTGTLTRSGGVLHLDSGSTLGGTLAISDGATLNGVGTVADLSVAGSVAPGNSPGTLTVTGNYVQGASGVYVCDVTPSANDLITVTGSATLGGTISIQPEYTYYNSGTVWTVLTAAGGVSGTYSTVTYGATPENWIFVPVYSANAVTVTLARQSYSNSATNSQASSVGSGLDAAAYSATGEMATLIKSLDYSYGTNAMYSANNALTNYALNVLSPEYYAAFSQNVFEVGRLLTGAQRAGLHEGQGGAAAASALNFGPAAVASQNADNGGIPAGIPGANAGDSQRLSLGRFDVFLKPLGLRASQQGRSDQTGYVTLAGGITGGLLYRPSPELTLGLAPGYVNQAITLHSEGGGQGTINDWSLGLLAAYRQGGFYADAGLRGAYDNFRSSRALPLPAGKYTAKANWDGWNLSASVGGGYDFKSGDYTFGPLASVTWQRLHENGFTEKGAGTIGQSVRARDTNALNTVLGGHVARTFETSIGDVTPEVRAAWSAQWLGDSQNIVATFIGSPSSTYKAKTKDQRYNSALVDLGVTVGLSDSLAATARVGVELFRPGYAAQAASVGLKFSF